MTVKINPLNILDCREVHTPPPYFSYHFIELRFNVTDVLRSWIFENLKGRFYIGETLGLEHNQFKVKLKIGFEEPRELSFFLLACSHLK